jgi:hypothetical protein
VEIYRKRQSTFASLRVPLYYAFVMTVTMDPPIFYSKAEFIETVRPNEHHNPFVLTYDKLRTQATRFLDALRSPDHRISYLGERLSYLAVPLSGEI